MRDFVVSAAWFLTQGRTTLVRNFLEVLSDLDQRAGRLPVMPASFTVAGSGNGARPVADLGDRAIGGVSPMDSMYWWIILLGFYARASHDEAFARRADIEATLTSLLERTLAHCHTGNMGLVAPDGSTMIDRPLGIGGAPLELAVLKYAALATAQDLLQRECEQRDQIARALAALREQLHTHYWLDLLRLQSIYRWPTEEFGEAKRNGFNLQPQAMPEWVMEWMPEDGGYFAGNLGPGRLDYRYFAYGNLLAIMFDLADASQTQAILRLYETRWHDLVGVMPAKICYPALDWSEWMSLTGSDPKNRPWSYHNGGNWPMLLWVLVPAAMKAGRRDLAERVFSTAAERLHLDDWPEYYDTRSGRFIGQRANLKQVWSAAALLFAQEVLYGWPQPFLFPTAVGPRMRPSLAA